MHILICIFIFPLIPCSGLFIHKQQSERTHTRLLNVIQWISNESNETCSPKTSTKFLSRITTFECICFSSEQFIRWIKDEHFLRQQKANFLAQNLLKNEMKNQLHFSKQNISFKKTSDKKKCSISCWKTDFLSIYLRCSQSLHNLEKDAFYVVGIRALFHLNWGSFRKKRLKEFHLDGGKKSNINSFRKQLHFRWISISL